jgi:hypothetical protein
MHVSLVAHVDGFFRLLFSLLSALLFFLELLGRDLFRRAEWPARSLDDGFGLVTAQLHGECVVQLGCRTRREHGTLRGVFLYYGESMFANEGGDQLEVLQIGSVALGKLLCGEIPAFSRRRGSPVLLVRQRR